MKKTYINPSTEIVMLTAKCNMLAGSLRKNSESVTDEADVLSRRGSFWYDEEDED